MTSHDLTEALRSCGFFPEEGYITTIRGKTSARTRYTFRHERFPIYVLDCPWFYDSHYRKWIHPDHIHEHLARRQ